MEPCRKLGLDDGGREKAVLLARLLKYELHQDAELFEKAYGYVKQYY